MITLCIHCLKPIQKLTASILPPSPADPTATPREPKKFTVSVQKLHATFVQAENKAELMLDVITDEPGITPDDVGAVDQYACANCGEVVYPQIHCYTIKGREKNPSPSVSGTDAEKDVPSGYVMVATMGANSRFDIRSQQEVRNAVRELIEFTSGGEVEETCVREIPEQEPEQAKNSFEWDY